MKTIVAFDFDGTLTKKDSFWEFIKFTKGKSALFLSLPFLLVVWVKMNLNLISRDEAKEEVFNYFFKGMTIEEFNKSGSNFKDRIDQFLRSQSLATIKKYDEDDTETIIVSASIENWIRPWANSVGIETVLATKVDVNNDGLLTGKFSTKNCRNQEKVDRLLNRFPDRQSYHLIAYGDSNGDKELLEFSNQHYMKYIR